MNEQLPVRIIQTTLAHPKAVDQSITLLFVQLDKDTDIAEICDELDIAIHEKLSADIDPSEKLTTFLESALDAAPKPAAPPPVDFITKQDLFPNRIQLHEPSPAKYFSDVLNEPTIIIEQSPPTLASFVDLLKQNPSGAVIGAYVGFQVATGPILLLAVPAGMIVCGAASGVAAGLEQWLRERIARMALRKRPKSRNDPGTRSGHTKGRFA